MKTSWGKPVSVISFIRTLLVVLAVAVGTVAADDLETLRKKAEAGNAFAQYGLGLKYAVGEGVPQDYAEAVKWYRKAAEQGDAYAQNNLGLMYEYGKGVPKDDAVLRL
jgi:TPR repeat protein